MTNLSVYWATTGIFPSHQKLKDELSSCDTQNMTNMKYFLYHKINTINEVKLFLIDLVELFDYEDDIVNESDFHNVRKWFLVNLVLSLDGKLIYPYIDNQIGWTDELLKKYSSLIDHFVELASICHNQKTVLFAIDQIIKIIENFLVLDCFFRDVCGSNLDSLELLIDELQRRHQSDFDQNLIETN